MKTGTQLHKKTAGRPRTSQEDTSREQQIERTCSTKGDITRSVKVANTFGCNHVKPMTSITIKKRQANFIVENILSPVTAYHLDANQMYEKMTRKKALPEQPKKCIENSRGAANFVVLTYTA